MKVPFGRHIPFYIAAVLGVVALVAAMAAGLKLATTLGANIFFLAYFGLVLWEMPSLTPDYLRKNAGRTDLPVPIIFSITFVIVCMAIFGLFQLINAASAPGLSELLFAAASIPFGWFTIHTMCALHYAHLYWFADPADKGKARQPHGGLDFPGDTKPGGWDFLYFATVIGMTAQTADTAITTTRMRRAALLHCIVSFFFNTVIVAAAVNIAVSAGGK